jgi:hypothetical protein
MIDQKFLISLIGISFAVYAILNLSQTSDMPEVKEGFLGNLPSMQVKVERSVGCANGVDFYSVPQFQSMLSPRFSNTDYGANIQYNLPDYKNLATPCTPLMMGEMINETYKKEKYTPTSQQKYQPQPKQQQQLKENYDAAGCVGCGPTRCGKGGENLNLYDVNTSYGQHPGYAAGNFNAVAGQLYSDADSAFPQPNSMFPVGDMKTVNGLGEACQAVVYDRYIYANRNSRLRAMGDVIRGDLAITPCSGNWFTPSVQPNIDLQEGALNVLGGFDAEQQKKLSDLIYASSGGTQTAIAGVNLAPEYTTNLCAGKNDIIVSAFP